MNVPAQFVDSGDDLTTVSLRALLALRHQVGRDRVASQLTHAPRSGQQASRLYGRGMDYAESRAYQRGDDARRLDWRLTARSGKLHTKLFQEDREGSVLIVLDTHRSMHFATRGRFKSVQAARMAAAVAWRAVGAGEQLGLAGFGSVAGVLRPRGGVGAALSLCGELAHWDTAAAPQPDELLSAALRRLRPWLRRASRVVIISDGFSCDPAARALLGELARRAATFMVLVADPLELALPPIGTYPVEHDGRRALAVLQSDRRRREFRELLGAGADRLRTLAAAAACRVLPLTTTDDAAAASADVFRRKQARAS